MTCLTKADTLPSRECGIYIEGCSNVPKRQLLRSKAPPSPSLHFFSEIFCCAGIGIFRNIGIFVEFYASRGIAHLDQIVQYMGVCSVSLSGCTLSVGLPAKLGIGQGYVSGVAMTLEFEFADVT